MQSKCSQYFKYINGNLKYYITYVCVHIYIQVYIWIIKTSYWWTGKLIISAFNISKSSKPPLSIFTKLFVCDGPLCAFVTILISAFFNYVAITVRWSPITTGHAPALLQCLCFCFLLSRSRNKRLPKKHWRQPDKS